MIRHGDLRGSTHKNQIEQDIARAAILAAEEMLGKFSDLDVKNGNPPISDAASARALIFVAIAKARAVGMTRLDLLDVCETLIGHQYSDGGLSEPYWVKDRRAPAGPTSPARPE